MHRASAIAARLRRLCPVVAFALAALGTSPAFAQSSSLFSATPSFGTISPNLGPRRDVFAPGGGVLSPPPSQQPLTAPPSPPPAAAANPMVPTGQVALALSARFGKDAPAIGGGL